ncbi:MAG: hypothetical protein M3413_05590, partial [Bacteroidota bacterium]|nr:hypothetical protein [Bacteroidota bacterium]
MRKNVLFPLFFVTHLILTSCATVSNNSANEPKSSAEEAANLKSVHTYWEEVWNKGNLQAVTGFYHPNA